MKGMRKGWWVCMLPWCVAAQAAPPSTLADCDGGFQRVLQPLAAAAGGAGSAAAALPARALWLDEQQLRWTAAPVAPAGARWVLHHGGSGLLQTVAGQPVQGSVAQWELQATGTELAPAWRPRFAWAGEGLTLALPAGLPPATLKAMHVGDLRLVLQDAQGHVLAATATQAAAALDQLYAAAETVPDLGVTVEPAGGAGGQARAVAAAGSRTRPGAAFTRWRLWAPTATQVSVCLHAPGREAALQHLPLQRDDASGVWEARLPRDLTGHTYTYLVDVWVRGVGWVRNRVTDPYSVSLTADSRRSWVGRLDSPALKPPGWDRTPPPPPLAHAVDQVVYELHVRDFSWQDPGVRPAWRGKYLAFTEAGSHGMRHLRAAARAGLTDVHLLPVFDLATVPERGCVNPRIPRAGPDSTAQQAAVRASAASDCFNWGYDPLHFNAPEGSYATDADDGAVRVREFRQLVMALHRAGLRVGMDVVYNHMSASGQRERSVLDRIVPGYYHRLDAEGRVETSTCCDNTATEHRMMARLMIDSAVLWVREYRIDSFRFDLMGHQPREAMERLQRAVDAVAGRRIELLGEGWNFGEVADGRRFVQASQRSLPGSGIATFSDRGRDAARGGGCCDNPQQTLTRQGWLNGLHVAPNGEGPPASREDLLRSADLLRLALAGTLREYPLPTWEGVTRRGAEIDYAGQPAGYVESPGEVVNYVENHDNQTLFDLNTLKLPRATAAEDRARVQVLGLALTAFSQGVAYYHAGVELLRSKSGDRNSYDSGDWFNRLDFTLRDNGWGSGLPPGESEPFWPLLAPRLADASIKPAPAHIRFTRDAWLDLLRIRSSTPLLRLRSAQDVVQRLRFPDAGPAQRGSMIVGHLDGRGLPQPGFAELLFVLNADPAAQTLALPTLAGRAFTLHPVHLAAGAADARVRQQARWDAATATLQAPARSAFVLVLPLTADPATAERKTRPAAPEPSTRR